MSGERRAKFSLDDRAKAAGGPTSGFDYLRIGLAIAVVAFHSPAASYGAAATAPLLWGTPWRVFPAAILPMFFALSGFLVTGSLIRNKTQTFATLRIIRIFPPLVVEIALSALILGPLFTTLPLASYLTAPEFRSYFLNMVGLIHYELPGVFATNPTPRAVNWQLWTIPFELECYVLLIAAKLMGLITRRHLLLLLVAATMTAVTVLSFTIAPINPLGHLPGRALVMAFVVGVLFNLYGDLIPYRASLALIAAVASAALLMVPDAGYLATVPLTYLTVWLGLTTPPKVAWGDYSYGVFLFGVPIQQAYAALFPQHQHWWANLAFALPLSLAYAAFSWNFIEKPLLDRRRTLVAWVDGLTRSRPAARAADRIEVA